MHVIKTLLLVVIIVASACTDDDTFSPNRIEFTEIAKNYLEVSDEIDIDKSNLIINSEEDYQALKVKMDAFNIVTNNFKESNLDFMNETVIAVITEIKTELYLVEIDSIIEFETKINVHYREKGTMALAMSQPYHIVRIPKSSKEIRFIE